MLARHFACKVRFNAPIDLLVLEEKALAQPFVTHNEDLLALMLPGLEAALSEMTSRRSLGPATSACSTTSAATPRAGSWSTPISTPAKSHSSCEPQEEQNGLSTAGGTNSLSAGRGTNGLSYAP
jgi:hypothetical protein